MNWDVWGPPLVVLGAGATLGLAVAVRSARQGRSTGTGSVEAWSARKDQLLEQLRELEADREKLDPAEYTARKSALVDQAAAALQAMERPEAEAAPSTLAPSRLTTLQKVSWAAGVAAFFVALGVGLQQNAKNRAQGASMTGGDQVAPVEADVEAARATLASNPKDIDALNVVTWYAIRSRDLQSAMATLDTAREVAPDHPLVLTHLAVLQLQVGMYDRADEALNAALKASPDLPRALFFRGLVRAQLGDKEGATQALERVFAVPATEDERQLAASLLSELKAPPPQDRVQGTVTLAPGLSPPTGGMLFIIAKRAAEGGGPPVAADRQSPTGFPVSFTLTDKDMMLGGAWPDQVWMQARIDADGNPTTKGEGDIESPVVGPLASGATGVNLVLGAN